MNDAGTTLAVVHRAARDRLRKAGLGTPDLDARLLVEHFTGTDRNAALLRPDAIVSRHAAAAVEQAMARRLAGEPVHRILGFREFHGLTLELSPATLEPRPDTEILVDMVTERLRAVGRCRILDLGTGTGAIALALLSQLPEAGAVGADLSAQALTTAQGNAKTLDLADRFDPVHSDWFGAVSGRFRAIVSNPPYIRHDDIAGLTTEVRQFDPELALDGGVDGLDAYRAIAAGAAGYLAADGIIAVEIGHDQKTDVSRVFAAFDWVLLEARSDLAGHDRALLFGR